MNPTLFDSLHAGVRTSDPITSRLAAEKVKPSRKQLVAAIRTVVRESSVPLSQFDIAKRIINDPRWVEHDWAPDTIRTRCSDADLWCVDTDGVTPRGSKCCRYLLRRV